jgi:hypothetical protein
LLTSLCVQGAQIAIVNKTDLVRLLMKHPKMKTLLGKGGVAHAKVQAQTGP